MPKRIFASDPGNAGFRIRMAELIRKCGGARKLSELAKVSHSSIRSYLRGSEPARPVLLALAAAGGISTDYLAGGKDFPVHDADFVPARLVFLEPGNQWREGTVLAKFHRTLVKERFNRANPDSLVLVEVTDHLMQPHIHRGELVVVDRSNKGPRDGFYALVMNSEIRVRYVSRIKDEVVVTDRRKREGRAVYSQPEFQRDVNIIGIAVLTGHYPEINDHNES